MNIMKKLILIALFFYIPVQTMAWGQLGHRVVAQIADAYLTPKARIELEKILGNESLAMAANWADFIKSDPNYKYLYTWHYVDLKEGMTFEQAEEYLKTDTIPNAFNKLNFMIKELKTNKTLAKDKKLLYVRMIIHVVGDIHQPFHAGRADDQGGNKIQLMWGNEQTNMHSIWDTKLIETQQYSYTEYAHNLNHTTAAQRAEWQKTSLAHWIYESNQIAESLYGEIKEPNQKLNTYNYIFLHIHTAEEQMLKGGVRLAGILNQIFG
ncbi:S1/P1 nuclease [Mucilaginibacter gracilis]|uniref:S1/P1 nuclease n=2 Tax=Mucilaginibacter gracilis TaxID=423350 RepID=A0A495J439_9SPHI|nr:S1/P1 nuclease [Mucilaginibacter gracilis]